MVFYPGLHGGFVFDDYANIVTNQALRITNLQWKTLLAASFSGDAGPLKRPLSLLSFSLNIYLNGLNPTAFKITNLIIHLITSLTIYWLAKLILIADSTIRNKEINNQQLHFIAIATTLAWSIHPIQVTSVLYVVQRMTSLAALFSVLSLNFYLRARLSQLKGKTKPINFVLSLLIFYPLAIASKETGILVPLYILIIEILFLRFAITKSKSSATLRNISYGTCIALSILLFTIITTNFDYISAGYENRSFTLTQRILTETRAIFFYLRLLLLPQTNTMGLYHDDFPLSDNIYAPITTLISLAAIIAAISSAFSSINTRPYYSFAVFFFIAGHSFESTIFPLELVYEHRNYLPSFGIILFLNKQIINSHYLGKTSRQLIITLWITTIAITTATRAYAWGNPIRFAQYEATHHPFSSRAHYEIGSVYAELLYKDPLNALPLYPLAIRAFEQATELSTTGTSGLFGLLTLSHHFGSDIPQEWLEETRRRLSSGPFAANNVNLLEWVATCENQTTCSLPDEIVESLFISAISNERLKGRIRSELLVSMGKFYILKKHDSEKAIFLFAQAAELSPHVTRFRIYLARALTQVGRFEDARSELNFAKSIDKLGIRKIEIIELDQDINQNLSSIRSP